MIGSVSQDMEDMANRKIAVEDLILLWDLEDFLRKPIKLEECIKFYLKDVLLN